MENNLNGWNFFSIYEIAAYINLIAARPGHIPTKANWMYP